MSTAQFNKLNIGVASLSTTESDWIGVNSPALLVFRQGGKSVSFRGTRRSGGSQIASGADPRIQDGGGEPVVTSVAFNVGGSGESLTTYFPILREKCRRVAALIGAPLKIVRDAAAASELMRSGSSGVEICSAEGERLAFSINAWGWPNEGGFDEAYLDGYLSCRELFCETAGPNGADGAAAAPPKAPSH